MSAHNLRSHYPFEALRFGALASSKTEDRRAPGAAVLDRFILLTIWRLLWHFVSYVKLSKVFRAAINVGKHHISSITANCLHYIHIL